MKGRPAASMHVREKGCPTSHTYLGTPCSCEWCASRPREMRQSNGLGWEEELNLFSFTWVFTIK